MTAPQSETPRSKYAELLNRLWQMQDSPYYATAKTTLRQAEETISELEREVAALRERNAELVHNQRIQDSATAAVMERAEKAEAQLQANLDNAKELENCVAELKAALAAETERCAKICEELSIQAENPDSVSQNRMSPEWDEAYSACPASMLRCAAAIRRNQGAGE